MLLPTPRTLEHGQALLVCVYSLLPFLPKHLPADVQVEGKPSFFSNLRVFIVCCCVCFVERHTIQSSSKTHPHPLQESVLEGPRKLCPGRDKCSLVSWGPLAAGTDAGSVCLSVSLGPPGPWPSLHFCLFLSQTTSLCFCPWSFSGQIPEGSFQSL